MGLRIQAELGGDGTGFERMMAKAGVTANNFANSSIAPLKNLIAGAFSVGAISALTRSTVQLASHFRDISDELAVNVEWLQEMQFVTKQNGANVDDLEKALRKITLSREAALGAGGEKQLGAFAKFGIGTEQIQHGKLTDIFDKIAQAFEQGNQQELLPAFQAIGGKGAAVLIPSFLEGLAKGRAAARESGSIIAEDVVDQLDDLGDSFDRLKLEVTGKFAPVIITVIDLLRKATVGLQALADAAATFVGTLGVKGIMEANHFAITEVPKAAFDFFNPFSKVKSIPDTFKELFDKLPDSFKTAFSEGLNAGVEDVTIFNNKLDSEAKQREARRNRRHSAENANLSFEPLTPEKERFQFAKNSDSLSSIGNFLGGTGAASALVAIGEKTNQLLQQVVNNTAPRQGPPTESGVPP